MPAEGCALRKEYYFHDKVALSLNGMIEKCTTLDEEFGKAPTEWQMLEVGEVTVPCDGLGSLSRETYTGTFSHKSFQKGRSIDISATLLWSLGRKELFEGSWSFVGKDGQLKAHPIYFEEDGMWLSFIDPVNKLSFHGKYVDTDPTEDVLKGDAVLKGDVERSGSVDGKFELTMREEQLRCSIEVMITGNENGSQQEGMMYSSNAFSNKGGGFKLPALQVPAQVSSAYWNSKSSKCVSKNCECNSKARSEYGLFIDRCYAFRRSAWLPNFGDGFREGSIRGEPSFRIG